LGNGSLRGVGFLLSYGDPRDALPSIQTLHRDASAGAASTSVRRQTSDGVRIGFIGAGNYATSMLLPHLRERPGVELVSVATTKALSSVNAQRKFGFTTISTSVESVLDDESLDAIFIVTRHHSHASLVCQALERGHAVFVEKPLALTEEQLSAVLDSVDKTGNHRVMVGFNRRFAPLFTDLRQRFGPFSGAVSARYLVNAGRLEADSWYLNEDEGSRFAGEGGHFIDTLSALVGYHPVEAYAMGTGSDIQATLRFADDSVAALSYLTDGSSRFPKETLDVAADGRNGRLDNFQRVTVWKATGKKGHRVLAGQDKGQRGQLDSFLDAVRTSSAMPISLESLVATTRATLAVERSLSSGRPVSW
jgi:predicted dehydrogenase